MKYTVSIDEVMAFRPCYDRAKVTALFAGCERLNAEDVLAVPVSARDRLWLLLRMAPRDVWMPAIWAGVERSICAASLALDKAGKHDWSDRLALLDPVVDTVTCQAAIPVLSSASAYASASASAYAYAYAYASASASAYASALTVAHVARLIAAAARDEEGK